MTYEITHQLVPSIVTAPISVPSFFHSSSLSRLLDHTSARAELQHIDTLESHRSPGLLPLCSVAVLSPFLASFSLFFALLFRPILSLLSPLPLSLSDSLLSLSLCCLIPAVCASILVL